MTEPPLVSARPVLGIGGSGQDCRGKVRAGTSCPLLLPLGQATSKSVSKKLPQVSVSERCFVPLQPSRAKSSQSHTTHLMVRLCVVSCLAYPLESRESTQPCSLGQRAGVCCRACQLLRSTRQVDLPLAVLLSQLSIHKALSNLYFIILRKKFTCYFSQYSYFFSELCEIIGHNLVFGSYLKFTGVILEFSQILLHVLKNRLFLSIFY